MKFSKIAVVFSMTALGLMASLPADAKVGGVAGRTTTGCNSCHSGGTTPTVTISGPTSVAAGSVNSYTITGTVPAGATNGLGCGLNAGATAGTVSAGTGTKMSGTEVVHNGVLTASGNSCGGSFNVTAPAAAGSYNVNGTVNMVNKDGRTGGDSSGLATLSVTVTGGTTTTAATTTGATTTGATTTGATTTAASTTMTTTTGGATTTMAPPTTLAGMPEAVMYCGFCHGLKVGKFQIQPAPYEGAPTRNKPAGMSERKWKRIIKKMMDKEGCPVDDASAKILAKYFSSIKR